MGYVGGGGDMEEHRLKTPTWSHPLPRGVGYSRMFNLIREYFASLRAIKEKQNFSKKNQGDSLLE